MVICLNCGALMIGGGRYEGVEELDEDDDWRIEPAVLHWYEACTLLNARLIFTYIFDARICMLSCGSAGRQPTWLPLPYAPTSELGMSTSPRPRAPSL